MVSKILQDQTNRPRKGDLSLALAGTDDGEVFDPLGLLFECNQKIINSILGFLQ